MNKGIFPAILLGGALFSGPALAAKNVSSTSQKGSLLIYPKIDVDPVDTTDTLIEISNDQNTSVQIVCYYVNERKDRVNFEFTLTGKQTASWDVGTGAGDQVNPPPFPSGGTFGNGDVNRGELVCFATDNAVQNQIAWNHLTGTATVVDVQGSGTPITPVPGVVPLGPGIDGDPDAAQPLQGYRYNAWAFAAEASSGLAADNTIMGAPGTLVLSGSGAGTYDACPQYNIANFMPGAGASGGGATLGPLNTLDNDLTVVSCNQDLRQDFQLHLTKLQFTVWNSKEQSYTGAYVCVDSVEEVPLDPSLDPADPSSAGVHDIANFTFPTLTTANARFQVQGVASTQCPGTENAGLLGVLTSSVNLTGGGLEDVELGSTTQGAGAQAGFVKWDPFGSGPTPQASSHH
jgi:hypothetical protein